MALTQKQKLKYYRNKGKVARKVILENARKKKHIVYGARALNAHFPPYLDRHTEDFDVLSKTPRKTAYRIEKKLDKHYGGDFFYVEKAIHSGTYRVKSRVTKRGVADYTKQKQRVPSNVLGGVRYITIKRTKTNIKRTLKDQKSKYRYDKDREALQRIKIYEGMKKK